MLHSTSPWGSSAREAPLGRPRLRGKSSLRFAAKQALLQFGELGFEDLDLVRLFLLLDQRARMQALVIMSLLAQPDVFQPKFFFGLGHRKASLPGDWARVPNKMHSRENTLRSRFIRRNRILVVHRIFTSGNIQVAAPQQVNPVQSSCNVPRSPLGTLQDFCLPQNPGFIGLISMITGRTLPDDIAPIARRVVEQGQNILGLTRPEQRN